MLNQSLPKFFFLLALVVCFIASQAPASPANERSLDLTHRPAGILKTRESCNPKGGKSKALGTRCMSKQDPDPGPGPRPAGGGSSGGGKKPKPKPKPKPKSKGGSSAAGPSSEAGPSSGGDKGKGKGKAGPSSDAEPGSGAGPNSNIRPFGPAKQGNPAECPPQVPAAPPSQSTLEDLFKSVKPKNSVPMGLVESFPINPPTAALFTTGVFYGCTVVVIVDGKRVAIGHFAQHGKDCTTMETEAAVKEKITEPLLDKVNGVGLTDAAYIFIITPASSKSIGYKAIVEVLTESGAQVDNIKYVQYASMGSGGFGTDTGPKGKTVVQVVPREGGGSTVNVYIERDTPKLTVSYDADGNLC